MVINGQRRVLALRVSPLGREKFDSPQIISEREPDLEMTTYSTETSPTGEPSRKTRKHSVEPRSGMMDAMAQAPNELIKPSRTLSKRSDELASERPRASRLTNELVEMCSIQHSDEARNAPGPSQKADVRDNCHANASSTSRSPVLPPSRLQYVGGVLHLGATSDMTRLFNAAEHYLRTNMYEDPILEEYGLCPLLDAAFGSRQISMVRTKKDIHTLQRIVFEALAGSGE